jgi:tetratricopeptide (TPR) repeat protein
LPDLSEAATDAVAGPLPDDSSFISPEDATRWLTTATNKLRNVTAAALANHSEHAPDLLRIITWWLVFIDRHDHATTLYQQARDLFEAIGDRLGQADVLNGLGDAARMRDEYEEAVGYHQQARHLFEAIGYRYGQANVLLGEARFAKRRGKVAAAVALYGQAAGSYRVLGGSLRR